MHDSMIRAALWAVASVAGVATSFVWAQLEGGADPTTVVVGIAGITGLVGLIWRLLSDAKTSGELLDQVQESLREERAENRELRIQLRAENRHLRDQLHDQEDPHEPA